jgi:HEPN domain-containing protein
MWNAEDWLLRGDYCPESAINATLESIRRQCSIHLLIHLAVDRTALLRTLILAASEDETGSNVELELRRPSKLHGKQSKLFQATRRIAFAASSNGRPGEPEQKYQSALARLPDALRRESTTLRAISDSQIAVLSSGYEGASIRSVLVAVGAFGCPITPEDVKRLAAMVNATPQAESRRDARWMDHSQVLPMYPDYGNYDFELEMKRFVESALELALRITSASHASMYLNRASEILRLTRVESRAFRVEGEPAPPEFKYPLHPDISSADSDLSDVLERQRSIQRRLGSTFRPVDMTGSRFAGDGAEMLCPIPWTSASPAGPAAGVMVLQRLPAGRSFSAQDLAFARNVCLRVAIHRNASAAGHIAAAVSRLRRGVNSSESDPEDPISDAGLPSDVLSALSRISPTLPIVAEATDSHSVSLRLLGGDGSTDALHGQMLRRVAVFPDDQFVTTEEFQHDDGGANWAVVRSGTPEVISDVQLASHYTPVRPNTRSELSVPVRSDGRLIGVLNLESPYLDHYAALSPLVEAFASGVGRTLVDAMADHSRGTLARSLAMDNLHHDLTKHIDEAIHLDLQHAPIGSPVTKELDQAKVTINRIRLSSQENTEQPMALGLLLQRAAAQASIISFDPIATLNTDLHAVICDRNQVIALDAALKSIFANVVDHGSTSSAQSPARIEGAIVEFDGSPHVALRITSESGFPLDPALVADLYRVPVYGTKKQGKRIGAYLAGTNARAIRGMLNAAIQSGQPSTLLTSLSFPVSK